ncbi:transcriptional regulator [Psychroserpens jangbogonensis]|uniref:transcriptional regulator n=1 Tax=Psychroserpens jangbogonensis TaxID=1484460 RepID=UPI00053E8755|nr:transcriptional regulator [Psychroserpens jangbogonensis]
MKKYKTLGDLMTDYRSYHSISQSELASEFDVDIRSVIRWEKNETLLSSDKENAMADITFIPYQVIRNLNTTTQIPTFYDFDLRKYSLSAISSDLPDANWIKSRINNETDRIKQISLHNDLKNIIRFIELQKNPLKSQNIDLITEACKLLPELNIAIHDQSGYYSGHCIYFPLSMETYLKIKNREIDENQLKPRDLINYKNHDNPVFYCHSITADCNENFFYIIGTVLKFYRDTPIKNYLYALLTSRYDSHLMSDQLGVKTVWKDEEAQKKYNLLDTPRLVEGNFSAFLKS